MLSRSVNGKGRPELLFEERTSFKKRTKGPCPHISPTGFSRSLSQRTPSSPPKSSKEEHDIARCNRPFFQQTPKRLLHHLYPFVPFVGGEPRGHRLPQRRLLLAAAPTSIRSEPCEAYRVRSPKRKAGPTGLPCSGALKEAGLSSTSSE